VTQPFVSRDITAAMLLNNKMIIFTYFGVNISKLKVAIKLTNVRSGALLARLSGEIKTAVKDCRFNEKLTTAVMTTISPVVM